jgi:hypothetical protein
MSGEFASFPCLVRNYAGVLTVIVRIESFRG